ncbi:hypothetical protein [Arcticibacterium luteifluviistationis]|uniref:Uncharacterized protein n=1 Tax=Arcticibacterium luteifluviistationis TaxID=1784714 RepID=A0A2Z4GH37_9BACT|nr:hypothetical protein [Arcticibacterium luteifluviistationis]AWW00335.1 hypothetical protein DJ013_20015 [Arcticibacterium luteifluviistationis]
MRKLLPLLFILTSLISYSQDLLTTKDGIDIESKILEVLLHDVKYKKFNNLNGPTFTIPKSDILIIRYENGTKDIFVSPTVLVEPIITQTSSELYQMGITDAYSNYRAGSSGRGGTFFVTLLSPIVGLIPAIACSSNSPRDSNLNFPNDELKKNPSYYSGYKHKATRIKKGQIWKNWGIALGINLVATVVLVSSQSQY